MKQTFNGASGSHDKLLKKLDLEHFFKQFYGFFAREKSYELQGDAALHLKIIEEIGKLPLKELPKVKNLDQALLHLNKSGVLKLEDLFEFVKIVRYFLYLQEQDFTGRFLELLNKIIIPAEFFEVERFFDEKGLFRYDLNEDLRIIHEKKQNLKNQIREVLKIKLCQSKLAEFLVDSSLHLIEGKEVLLLKGSFNKVLKGTVLGRSRAGFFYVWPLDVAQLQHNFEDLCDEELAILYTYEKKFSAIFKNIEPFLKFINRTFDTVDQYFARMFFAKNYDYKFVSGGGKDLILEEFKHPALKEAKPFNIALSKDKNVLLITGVNAGGKTMLLKSILSAAFLCKYFIPFKINALKSQIPRFKNIQAIIEDPQNSNNNISTFAGRMSEFAQLFKNHQNGVLVGVDEIELGTDSEEAASLFKVIIEELIQRNMKVIVTTHHKCLAVLLSGYDSVDFAAALYDEKQEKPTFEFLQGIIGNSYAFETAKRYGIAQNIVDRAKKSFSQDQEKLNDLIVKGSELKKTLRQKQTKLDNLIDQNETKSIQLKNLKQEQFMAYENEISKLNASFMQAIEEAKKAARSQDQKSIHRFLNKAHGLKSKIEQNKEIKKQEPLKVGDNVKFNNSVGVVQNIKGCEAIVVINGLRVRVEMNELTKTQAIKENAKKTYLRYEKPKNLSVRLDLHGQRYEEAQENLENFINDALMGGLDEVLIFHGVGSGILASMVSKVLSHHPRVKSFEDASANMGGMGAKVVRF